MFSSKYVCQIFLYVDVFFIHKISPYINANISHDVLFIVYLSTGSVNFITLAVWRREKQVSSARLDYYVSLRDFSIDDSSHF